MNDERLSVYISSGRHFGSIENRISDIETSVDSADVAFIEAPGRIDSLRRFIYHLLTVPFLMAPAILMRVLIRITDLFGWSDRAIVRYIVEEHDAEPINTDIPITDAIDYEYRMWLIGHWMIAVFFILLARETFFTLMADSTEMILPTASTMLFSHLVVASDFLLWIALLSCTSVAVFSLFLAGTALARDSRMARDIIEYAEENTGETACLLTGGEHDDGVRALLEEDPNIKLIE
jgi:hypothetical protein